MKVKIDNAALLYHISAIEDLYGDASMAQYLAIVAYRGLVAGVRSDSLDVQVRWFDVEDEAAVRRLIARDPIHSYKNSEDETVSWELAAVLAIEPFAPKNSGDEVIGFIASTKELTKLT